MPAFGRASALLCASSLPAQDATLVCGHLEPNGSVAIVNAGHPAPLVIRTAGQATVEATGVPIGLFCKSEFATTSLKLNCGDTLIFFTDGLTEARDARGAEYERRVERAAAAAASMAPHDQVNEVIRDQASFRGDVGNADDLTVLSVQRARLRDDSPAP